ncbi:MAG: carboxypeptidase-like regulatory domain-containing protein [Isosphaeraceae bacterium]
MNCSHVTKADRSRRCIRVIRGLFVAGSLGLTGCGGSDSLPSLPVYEVKGKVVLADGKPLTGGFISFVPRGDLPVTPGGAIGPDGTFSLVTGGSGEGAPPGDYKVRVEAPQFQQAGPKSRKRPLYPFKYTDEDSSGLVVTVRAETNRLEPIVLK